MNKYLFSISIGPVQDFIAAARRTRDLWFGSQILSEISKQAALAAHRLGAELIFPFSQNPEQDFRPGSDFSVANKLLFELQSDHPPKAAETIREAVQKRWEDIADEVLAQVESVVDSELWHEQIADVIEFYAAWIPRGSDYREDRIKLERLLAGSKLRHFEQANGRHGVPKSSLDGARESVLTKRAGRLPRQIQAKTRLKDHEQLDAIGLIKRLGKLSSSRRSYPSVSTFAASPWVRGLPESAEPLLDTFKKLCSENSEQVVKLNPEKFAAFPYEGAVLFEERLMNTDEIPLEDHARQAMLKILRNLYKQAGRPSPYFAILLADGDRMGASINGMHSAEEHQKFSQSLSEFSQHAVPEIVEQHHGFVVYSGGDDVLAFLPIDTSLNCAAALSERFKTSLQHFAANAEEAPTLSVGLALGHCTEPLEDLLEMARKAEKKAKNPDRNGLAIYFQTRSGGDPIVLRQQWPDALHTRLQHWAALHRKELISDKAAYDLRQLAWTYTNWEQSQQLNEALKVDVTRLLKRKKPGKGALSPELIEKLLSRSGSAQDLTPSSLMETANELILARHLAQAYQQANVSVQEVNA